MRIFILLSLLVAVVTGSHYRGGSFNYEKISESELMVRWRLAAKRSWGPEYECNYAGEHLEGEYNGMLRCVDCEANQLVDGPLEYDCISFSEDQNWSIVEGSTTYTADRSKFKLIYQIEPIKQCQYSSNWIDLVNYGRRLCWRLVTKVDLTKDNKHSPVVTMLPVYTVRAGCKTVIPIEASDADGDTVRCRWARLEDGECPLPVGGKSVCGQATSKTLLDEEKCELTIPSLDSPGWYGASIMVEDFKKDDLTEPLSSIPFQFLLNVTEPGSCVGPSLIGPECEVLKPGQQWSGDISASLPSKSEGTNIIALLMSPPTGMTFEVLTTLPAPTASATLTYTVPEEASGVLAFCYTALDNNWVQGDPVCSKLLISSDEVTTEPIDNEPPALVPALSIPAPGAKFSNKPGQGIPKTWRLTFSKPFDRPKTEAFIRIKASGKKGLQQLATFNVADPEEVAFVDGEKSAVLEFKPPLNKLKDGANFMIEVDAGTAVVYKKDLCGNAPAENENPVSMYGFETEKCKSIPPPKILPAESIPAEGQPMATGKPWQIKFSKKIKRPSKPAFIKIIMVDGNVEAASFDVSDPSQVVFPDDDQTVLRYTPTFEMEDDKQYSLSIGKGIAVAAKTSNCKGDPKVNDNVMANYNFLSPPPLKPFSSCDENSMTFFVPHKYVSKIEPTLLHLHDKRCTAKNFDKDYLIVKTFYDECATKSKRLGPNSMRYMNTLRSTPEPVFAGASATRKVHEVDIRFICDVKGTGVNTPRYNSNNGVEGRKFSGSTNMKTYLALYTDKTFSKKTELKFPNVSFSDVLYFGANADDSTNRLEIESCRAVAKDKTCTDDDEPYVFIEKGCPVDSTVRFLDSTDSELRFSISAFAIIGKGLDHDVIVRCRMVACNARNADDCDRLKEARSSCGPAKG
ncbi:uncharacterized protein [Antedon mediterranea]|uniref:uncharacterized protein n=1 Tax=Antedon mediterranea TaxID=105859 RepID=UPI003AF6DD14